MFKEKKGAPDSNQEASLCRGYAKKNLVFGGGCCVLVVLWLGCGWLVWLVFFSGSSGCFVQVSGCIGILRILLLLFLGRCFWGRCVFG